MNARKFCIIRLVQDRFLKVLLAWQLQYSPTDCGNLRKHFTKPFSQTDAPDCSSLSPFIFEKIELTLANFTWMCKSWAARPPLYPPHSSSSSSSRGSTAASPRSGGNCTELAKKVCTRLRDSACWRSGEITQPRTNFCGHPCIKIGLPGKSNLRDYFQENMTSRRPIC